MHEIGPVTLYLGLERYVIEHPRLHVHEADLHAALETKGEFYILDMAKHDDDYGRGNRPIVSETGLAVPPGFEQPSTRLDSTNVIGNIGEAIGAVVVQRAFGLTAADVIRIRRQSRRGTPGLQRCPDFVVSVPPAPTHPLVSFVAERSEAQAKRHEAVLTRFTGCVPIEVKAAGGDARGSKWSALWQLISYWRTANKHGDEIHGAGCIVLVSNVRNGRRPVQVYLLLARDSAAFRTTLMNVKSPVDSKLKLSYYDQFQGGAEFIS